jgi:carbon monoxide dehydrogenase subunit G
MLQVRVTREFRVPASRVWAWVRDFDRLPEWVPGIRASRLEGSGIGAVRHLDISSRGGQWASERLDALDEDGRTLVYSIVDASLPLARYTSTMRVIADAGGIGCILDWSAVFEARGATDAEAVAFVTGAYEAGSAKLASLVEG